MSRRRTRVRKPPAAKPGVSVALARLRLGMVWIAATAIVALAIWKLWPSHSAPAGPDAAAAVPPSEAYRRAVELSSEKRFRESVIYYRRALGHAHPDFSDLHLNYALALYDLTVQYTVRAGRVSPATRSSVERIELSREAFEELDRAAQLAATPAALARVLSFRANMQLLWGFPWDALQSYRAAQHADSTNPALAERANRFVAVMRTPSLMTLGSSDSAATLPKP